ncbi:MFS transporter [Mailhella massiliensis]|uniref:MFS transporter n=1 Tax=Mailhella massiliensis TaxID=1903261 RepID=UPI0023EF9E0D|nr:MFS transporter [Mailhella massiliensis]
MPDSPFLWRWYRPRGNRHVSGLHAGHCRASACFLRAGAALAERLSAGSGAGQLFWGPVIDRFGRRIPLLSGLVLFAASSFWAGCSDTLGILILSRFIQGLAGALLLVIGFSSVSDVAHGTAAAGIFSVLMTVEGLAPIFAPVLGGFIDEYLGWRAVLWASSAMAVLALINSILHLKETLPPEKRLPLHPASILKTYLAITCDKGFLLPTLALSAVFFYLFAYIAGGAYLYQSIYSLSPDTFGLIFGITGGGIMLGAVASGRLVKKTTVGHTARLGVTLMGLGTLLAMTGHLTTGFPGIMAGFLLAMFGMGMAEPMLVSLAMSSQKGAAGFTAALMGACHLLLSAFATPLSGFLLPLSSVGWFIFLLLSALGALAVTVLACPAQKKS